jgi:hypothetical protein
VELLAMLTGILIGAAAASLVAFGWAASQLRWLGAHCNHQIAYWRNEANRAGAALLRERQAANRAGSLTGCPARLRCGQPGRSGNSVSP